MAFLKQSSALEFFVLAVLASSSQDVSGGAGATDPDSLRGHPFFHWPGTAVPANVTDALQRGQSLLYRPGKNMEKAVPYVPLPVLPEPPVPANVTDAISDDMSKDALHSDIFSRRPGNVVLDQHHLLKAAPLDEWLIMICSVIFLLSFDVYVFQRNAAPTFGWNIAVLFFWIAAGLAYNGYFAARYGQHIARDWLAGYFLEWLLSIDNLFLFHLIFKTYKTPANLQPMALLYGIVGAVVLRMFFFLFIGELISMVHWVRFVFGGLLVYSGIETAIAEDEEEDMQDTMAVNFLKGLLGSRLLQKYDLVSERLFVTDGGVVKMTLLVFVIFCLWGCDAIFAVDSVSAKVAQIPNQYVAYCSSVFAMLGWRAMFVIIQDLVQVFDLLKYGICIIFCFIGFQLMLADYVHLDSATVCFVIMSAFTVFIAVSVAKNKKAARAAGAASHQENPPRKHSVGVDAEDTDAYHCTLDEISTVRCD